ncbi:MAG: hypothetical protein ACI4PC_03075 [Oscillospiraceae bacterium]
MEFQKIVNKILEIKADAEELRALPELEPCYVACLDSILSHTNLMCNELGLDVDMPLITLCEPQPWDPEANVLDTPT